MEKYLQWKAPTNEPRILDLSRMLFGETPPTFLSEDVCVCVCKLQPKTATPKVNKFHGLTIHSRSLNFIGRVDYTRMCCKMRIISRLLSTINIHSLHSHQFHVLLGI